MNNKKQQENGAVLQVCCAKCFQKQQIWKLLRLKINILVKQMNSSHLNGLSKQTNVPLRSNDHQQEINLDKKGQLAIRKTEEITVMPSINNNQVRNISQSFKLSTINKGSFFVKDSSQLSINEFKQKGLQRAEEVITSLTEEFLQLKSNLMHVRHCLYALFKEINMQKKVPNHILFNIFLAISNLFQFSQEEREEILHIKKIQLRKRQKVGKENIFNTVNQL